MALLFSNLKPLRLLLFLCEGEFWCSAGSRGHLASPCLPARSPRPVPASEHLSRVALKSNHVKHRCSKLSHFQERRGRWGEELGKVCKAFSGFLR